MSSILKALRRLEEEKRGGKVEAPDFRVDQGQSPPRNKTLISLLAGVLLGGTGVVLFLVLPHLLSSSQDKSTESQVVTQTVSDRVNENVQLSKKTQANDLVNADQTDLATSKIVAVPEAKPAPIPTQPVQAAAPEAKTDPVPMTQPVQAAAPEAKTDPVPLTKPVQAAAPEAKTDSVPVTQPVQAAVPAAKTDPVQAAQSGHSPSDTEPDTANVGKPGDTSTDESDIYEKHTITSMPSEGSVSETLQLKLSSSNSVETKTPSQLPPGVSLFVSEIYFQEDYVNSMAVVNDLPVMVGTHVDQAVVDKILPDRVLFQINGNLYSVLLSNQ